MLQNLAAGSGLVALSVLIHTGGLILIAATMPAIARRLGLHNHDRRSHLVDDRNRAGHPLYSDGRGMELGVGLHRSSRHGQLFGSCFIFPP